MGIVARALSATFWLAFLKRVEYEDTIVHALLEDGFVERMTGRHLQWLKMMFALSGPDLVATRQEEEAETRHYYDQGKPPTEALRTGGPARGS